MRILYLTQILSPSIGGGEAVFFNLAKGMLKLGHQVHVICHKKRPMSANDISAPSHAVNALKEMGVNIHAVKPELEDKGGILLTYRHQIGYILNALKVGQHLLRQNRIDLIHANVYTPILPAIILGKIFHIPVIITVHNIMFEGWRDWSSQKNVPRMTSTIGPFYEKMILRMRVEAIHVVSKKVKSEVMQFNPRAKAVVIYNGVETEQFLSNNLRSESGKFILYLGRLVIRKNLQVVIQAFRDVVKILPDAKLVVAGDGPMRQEWQELVNNNSLSNNVIFLGHISDSNTKFDLFTQCSAVAFPSIEEGFGLVAIEAFAIGKPVLISDLKPFDEIVDDNVDGFLLPPHDPTKWADKIVFMLNNPQVCEDMGKNGRKKVEQTFNMKVVSSKMEQLYKSVVSNI